MGDDSVGLWLPIKDSFTGFCMLIWERIELLWVFSISFLEKHGDLLSSLESAVAIVILALGGLYSAFRFFRSKRVPTELFPERNFDLSKKYIKLLESRQTELELKFRDANQASRVGEAVYAAVSGELETIRQNLTLPLDQLQARVDQLSKELESSKNTRDKLLESFPKGCSTASNYDTRIQEAFEKGETDHALAELAEAAGLEKSKAEAEEKRSKNSSIKASYYLEIRAHTLITELRFIDACNDFCAAAALLSGIDETNRTRLRFLAAYSLEMQGKAFVDRGYFIQSIELLESIIIDFRSDESPFTLSQVRWYLIKNLRMLGQYEIESDSLKKAVSQIELLLTENISAIEGVSRVSIFRELSVLEQELGRKERNTKTMESAVSNAENSLQLADHGTCEWAISLGELASAQLMLGERLTQNTGDTSYLLKSLHSSRKARKYFRYFGMLEPECIAATNMVSAYQRLAHQTRSLPEAIEAIRLATLTLEKSGYAEGSLQWGNIKSWAGISSRTAAVLSGNKLYFVDAKKALRQNIKNLSAEKAPHIWANANKNIALTISDECRFLFIKGETTTLAPSLYEAIGLHQNTLSIFSIQLHPYQWAWEHFELAKLYSLLAKVELSLTKITEAKSHLAEVRNSIVLSGWNERGGNIESLLSDIEDDESYILDRKKDQNNREE